MRKKIFAAVVAALAATTVVLATAGPAPAGGPAATITVTKVVTGTEPAGASYVVNVSCIGSGQFTGDNPNGSLNFAAGGGSQPFDVLEGYEGDCTFVESGTSGATPTYACSEVDTGTSTCGGGGVAPSTLNVNDPSLGALATITITNTFTAAATAPVEAAATAPVEADPSTLTG